MARLLIKSPLVGAESIELRTGVNRLGRSSGNDFPIDHPTVSSAHCEVTLAEEGVLVRDLGSTNGTFIAGQKIQEQKLLPGQMLKLGELEMFLDPEEPRVAIPRFDTRPARMASALPEGVIGCENHPGFPASDRCGHCGRAFCDPCVHVVRRRGGLPLRLCPMCSSPVVAILAPTKRKENFFLSLMRRTLRLFTRRMK
jgi:hypothetical protein